MEYFSGVRFENFIIYSKDLNDDNLEFLQNYKEQTVYTTANFSNSIAYDGKQYILYEWVEYYVVGINGSRLTIDDFANIGQYYRNNSGSILLKNFVGYIRFANQKYQLMRCIHLLKKLILELIRHFLSVFQQMGSVVHHLKKIMSDTKNFMSI